MPTAFTDFSGDSNGALDNSASWTNGRLRGSWAFTVQTDAGATGGKSCVVVPDTGWGTDGLEIVLFDDVAGAGTTGDIEIVTRFKFDTAPTAGEAFAVGPMLVSSASSQNAYGVYYNGSGGWRITRWDAGVDNFLQTAASIYTPADNSYMWIRLARKGTTIKANVWGGAAGDEPAGFNISGVTDTTYSSLRIGIVQQKVSYALTFDVFGASDTGVDGSAPSTGGPVATVEQEGVRFGEDDGSESAHTWAAAQDANLSSALSLTKLIRFLLNGTLDFAATAFTLRYQKNGAGGYVAVPVGSTTTPTLTYGEAGALAYSAAAGSSVAPAYPANITTRSGLVLVVGQKPSSANSGTVTTPSGWTLQASLTGANDGNTGGYTTTLGADTGNCNIFVYTKDTVTGSESGTLSVTVGTNDVCWAQIIRLQASADATWSWAAATGKDTSAGSVSIATGSMAIASGDLVIGAMVIPTDVTTPSQFSAQAFAQTGTTFGTATEVSEPDSTTGNDIGGFVCYAAATAGSGSGAVTLSATAGGTTTNVRGPGIVLRARVAGVANQVYIAPSSNITAGGEATTARLTAPSGKTTSDFVTGRRWDDENGSDAIDLTTDDYTELEWAVAVQAPAADGDYFDFRVYAGSTPLDTYTVTPRWTVGTAVAFNPVLGMRRPVTLLRRH